MPAVLAAAGIAYKRAYQHLLVNHRHRPSQGRRTGGRTAPA